MILESVKHGSLIWPTIEENCVTRTKKYEELFATKKIQADCELKETNIIFQGLPFDVYSLVNHHKVFQAPYPNAYTSIVHQDACPQTQSIPQIEYTISIVNQQTHLAEFPQIDSSLAVPVFKQGDDPIDAINKMMLFLSTFGRQSSFAAGTYGTRANISGTRENNSGQQRVVKCFNCQREGHMARQCPKLKRKRDATWFRDKFLLVEAQGFAKVLNEEELTFLVDLGVAEDVLSEVPHSKNTDNDMINQSVQEMLYSEQTHLVNYPDNEITKKNAQFEDFEKENNYLKQTLFEQLKEKELLTKTFNVLKNECKEKEAKNNDKEIALEKKVKELDNIVCKMGQFAQTMHMLTKLQVFCDNNLKQALGFQNPFYLKKAQQIRPMLYDGIVIAKEYQCDFHC
ncbi:ribonuclease H-like domain-containing protein [Tanacetum coccineum]